MHWVSSIYLLLMRHLVGKHNTVQHHKPAHRAHKFTLPEAVHSCLSFHVLMRTKTLPEDGTYVSKHVGAALVINTLTKPSEHCWFSMHNPAMHGTNIKLACWNVQFIEADSSVLYDKILPWGPELGCWIKYTFSNLLTYIYYLSVSHPTSFLVVWQKFWI
jgi:hypothetical protein